VQIPVDSADTYIAQLLIDIQDNLLARAKAYRTEHTTKVNSIDEMNTILDTKGGFCEAHWDGTTDTELKIKELTKATIRCIPDEVVLEDGKCILTGAPSSRRVLFARAY
jgi:prolyl-tRNA synthetase